VDDDPQFLRLTELLLSKEGWNVSTATGGEHALSRLHGSVEVLITDLDMPLMSGLELIESVRRDYQGLPIVVLTGAGGELEAVRCFRAGANDYVTKANVRSELIGVVRHLLEDSGALACASTSANGPSGDFEAAQSATKAAHTNQSSQASQASTGGNQTLDSEYRIRRRSRESRAVNVHNGSDGSLQSEYIIRPRSSFRAEEVIDPTPRFNGILSNARLVILRRQMQRLAKWSDLVEGTKKNHRRHVRKLLGEVVELRSMNADGSLTGPMQVFCKDLSIGGCSLLHHEALHGDNWVLRLPNAGPEPIQMRCKVVRSRLVVFGMFDIGLRFIERKSRPEPRPIEPLVGN
jgi:DNA-binding response OmpR family regulator